MFPTEVFSVSVTQFTYFKGVKNDYLFEISNSIIFWKKQIIF